MESLNLNQLIARLQQLHLEQERIIAALENIVVNSDSELVVDSDSEPAPVTVPVPAVSVAEPVHPTTPTAVPVPPEPTVAAFHIGQRVYITNRINHVLVRRATEADRTAIVTHFTATRVAIRTINGYHTNRHPKNLRPL
jgi:hypothetical protein